MSVTRRRSAAEARLEALAAGEALPEDALQDALREQLRLHRRLEKISRISDRYQAQLQDLNHQLAETNQQLSRAQGEVKVLRGFIPICAKCKRIRDDRGYWDQLEDYITRHSEAVFSHGVCPDCAQDLYGSLAPRQMKRMEPSPRTPVRKRRPHVEDQTLHARLGALLTRPEHEANPLREELAELLEHHLRLLGRFEKILKISDGFQTEMKHLNRALAEASRTDPLTGLLNRRGMMATLEAELARTDRSGAPMTLVMVDVDHFKDVSDQLGHEVGDLVLLSLGACLRGSLRGYDACARWGGEAFLILLPDTDADPAQQVALKVQELIAEHQVELDERCPPISVSMGLAMRQAGEPLDALLQRADAALDRAKHLGRNRIEWAEA